MIVNINNDFYIEYVSCIAAIPDAAGQTNGTLVTLERAGRYVGHAIGAINIPNNDNTQAISAVEAREPTGTLTFGDAISQVRVRVTKAAGTAGLTNISYSVIILMRK